MTTREEAIRGIAQVVAQARAERNLLSVEEAARRAHRVGGPSIPELEALIRSRRGIRKSA